MSIAIQNLNIAYQELGRNVDVALRTQLGDAARLNEQKRLCLQFLNDIRVVCASMRVHSFCWLLTSIVAHPIHAPC
jgi:hypothetical protein